MECDDRDDKLKINSTCRTCLACPVELTSIFNVGNVGNVGNRESSLAEQIWGCTGVRILFNERLPAGLCRTCRSDLLVATSFRNRCRQSDSLLQQYQFHTPYGDGDTIIPLSEASDVCHDSSCSFENDDIKVEVKLEVGESDFILDAINRPKDIGICQNEKKFKGDVEKKFNCHICNKAFCWERSVENHIQKVHMGKSKSIENDQRKYNCTECLYSSKRRQAMDYHMRTHTGERPYKCQVCNMRFAVPASLTSHQRTHSDKTYYTCDECGKQFKYRYSYEGHKAVHAETSKYICDLCKKGLKSKKTLLEHLNRHNNIKNYSCDTCGALFVTRAGLKNHSGTHSTEKKYKCDLCDFKSRLKSGLDRHLMRHSGEKPFKCDMCERCCYTKDELTYHYRKHTKEKKYSCPVCDVKFTHSPKCNEHMLKFHGIKYNRIHLVDRRTVK